MPSHISHRLKMKGSFLLFCLFNLSILFSQNPNILVIVADDLGIDALNTSDYGFTVNNSPNTPEVFLGSITMLPIALPNC